MRRPPAVGSESDAVRGRWRCGSPLSSSTAGLQQARVVSGSSGVGAPVGGENGKPNRQPDGTFQLGSRAAPGTARVKSGSRPRARYPAPLAGSVLYLLICSA